MLRLFIQACAVLSNPLMAKDTSGPSSVFVLQYQMSGDAIHKTLIERLRGLNVA